MSRAIWPIVAGTAILCAGCAASVVSRELSELPLAFVYHTEAEARQRAESASEREPKPYDPRSQTENRGVVDVNEFKDYLANAFGQSFDPRYRGRLVLLDARRDDIAFVHGAHPGAVPQAWSSDHRRLLFAQGDPGALQLYEFDRQTDEVAKLTHGPSSHPQGCYASEGRLVVTVHRMEWPGGSRASEQLTSRLAIRSPSGGVETISSGPADVDPACSPDGQRIAFVRLFGNRSQIWVRPLTPGAAARPITAGRSPAFSPDGKWIVFDRGEGKTSKLWRIRTDGGGRTRLGIGSGAEEYRPVVSPDGRFVVYESVVDNRSRLSMRRFDGSGDVVLFSSGDGAQVVW